MTTGGGGAYKDLVGMGMSEQDAVYYQQEFEAGRSVVAVSGSDRLQEASTILSTYGGYGASGRGSSGTATQQPMTDATTQQSMTGTEGEQRIHLREEQLQAYKQPVETGSVGLHKEVVSEQQSVDVPVTHEEVYIERRPGTGQPTDAPVGQEETYQVPVREEQVTTTKQTVDKGEVAIGKRQVQETKRISDTVSREEARIDRQGDVNVQGTETEVEEDR